MINDDYFKSDDFLVLLKQYEEGEKIGNMAFLSSDEYADLAEYYQQNGQNEKALHAAMQGIELYPGAIGPLVFRARYAICVENNLIKAENYAEQIEDKQDLDYFYIIAEIMIAKGFSQKADTYLDTKMDEVDDDDLMDYIYDVAMLFADYDLTALAEKWLNRYEDKDDPEYLELLGRILFGKGKYAEGEKIMNHLIDVDPFNSIYWNTLAAAQFQSGKMQEAIDSSEFSIAINPDDDEAIQTKAHGLFALGNYDEALQFYRRYNELRETEDSHTFIAICLMTKNQYKEALKHLKKAVKLAPPHSMKLFEIYQEMALAESQLGNLDKALTYIDKTDSLSCDHEDMLVLRGHLCLMHNELTRAYEYFSNAIHQTQNPVKILLHIAASAYDNGLFSLAFKMLKYLKDYPIPNNIDGYSYIAMYFYSEKDKPNFLKYLRLATDLNPIEAKNVCGELFPEDMQPQEYYDYAQKFILTDTNN